MTRRQVLIVGVIVGGLVCMAVRETGAAEWSAEPSMAVKGEYNSNLTLSSIPGEVWGHWMSPSVRFAGSTERLEVSGKAAADFVTYYGDQNRSLTNLYFPLTVRYTSERDVFGLDGGFTRDNTLMSELRQTGAVLSFTQRNMLSVSPSWTRTVTENLSLQVGYQFANATYENGSRLGLFDYDLHGGNLGASYKPTERDTVQLTGSYSKVDIPDNGLKIGNTGAALSFTHAFSESTSGTVFGGPKFLDQTLTVGSTSLADKQIIWAFGGSIGTKWEDAQASLDASRDVNVSGLGVLLRTDRLGAAASKDVTENVTVSLAGAVYLVQAVPVQGTGGIQIAETRVITVSPAVTWKLAQWWTLEAAYTYADRQIDANDDRSHGHSMFLRLTYIVPKLSFSR
ncbi:hypothetical protein [Nitrospira moscoviensis]|uniref:Porin n=1 Tax=Nitrospira moscoviensis TaxID=42253 RepID=A0A0K2GKH6_NITMO|nr:hypothetical protein [Nitrospira moscoviensis]ALA61132.1 conserved exported protein of unknown function [Nitrospira moscoviensis]